MRKTPAVFVREATGLVREVGVGPSLMTTFVLVTSNVPILWVASMYTAPGSNWPLAFLIVFFPTLFMGTLRDHRCVDA